MEDIFNSPEIQLMREIDIQIKDSPTDWEGDLYSGRGLETRKSVKVPGAGHFGLISLTGKISREADKYKCFTQAICLPIANDSTEVVDTLEAAKEHIVKEMSSLAYILALIDSTHQGQ